MTARRQGEVADELRSRLREVAERLAAVVSRHGAVERAWMPAGGGWSVDQVLEHLVLANQDYLVKLEPLVASSPPSSGGPFDWKPTLMGGLLVRSLESRRRQPAPRAWRPATAAARPDAHRRLAEQVGAIERLLDRAAAVEWRRARTSSPVSRLVRLDLGDCFAVLVTHMERHLGQAERTARAASQGGPMDAAHGTS